MGLHNLVNFQPNWLIFFLVKSRRWCDYFSLSNFTNRLKIEEVMIPRSGQNLGTGPVPWGKNDKIAESSTLGQYISTPKISECLQTLIVCFPQPRMNTVLIWRYHSFWFCQDITPKLTVWRDTGRPPQKKPSRNSLFWLFWRPSTRLLPTTSDSKTIWNDETKQNMMCKFEKFTSSVCNGSFWPRDIAVFSHSRGGGSGRRFSHFFRIFEVFQHVPALHRTESKCSIHQNRSVGAYFERFEAMPRPWEPPAGRGT